MQPKIQEIQGFTMYPNPAMGNEIYITTLETGAKKISVFDVFGEIVLQTTITTNTLNIARLVPGVYVLQVLQGSKKVTRKLVVK